MSLIREALKKAESEREGIIPAGEKRPQGTPSLRSVFSPVVTTPDPLVVCCTAPHSLEAEQYRNLRAHLYLSSKGDMSQVFMTTSAVAGEGKSLTAVNLAVAMAQDVDRKVILVDADLRAPKVHKLLGLPRHPGLSEYLGAGAPLDSVVSSCKVTRLSVICAGAPSSSPAELIGSFRMKYLIEDLRLRFDYVIFDTCPILPVSDSRILAALADGVILVVRAGRTRQETVTEALQRLEPTRVVGVVLNDVEALSPSYRYGGTQSQGEKQP